MEGNHLHVFVRDLAGALAWFARVWAAEPTYRDEGMAVLPFGPISSSSTKTRKRRSPRWDTRAQIAMPISGQWLTAVLR